MKRVVAAGGLGLALGCSGAWDQARLAKEDLLPGENRRACSTWVEHVNGLDQCLRVTYEDDNLCAGVDDAPAALAPWFECLIEHTACDGAEAKADWDACVPPSAALTELHG